MSNTKVKVDTYNYTRTIIELLKDYEAKAINKTEIENAKQSFHKALEHLELSTKADLGVIVDSPAKTIDTNLFDVIDTPSNENLGDDVFKF